MSSQSRGRVLVAIPAYNEAATIERVVAGVRAAAPEFDVLVVDDGSRDETAEKLMNTSVTVATHLCNLGYGRALQTAIQYARRQGYQAVITFDADGQHRPSAIEPIYEAFTRGAYDLLIGSRFVESGKYGPSPFARQIGMRLFSGLIALLTGQRVYDTTSGLKVINRRAFDVLLARPFVDFHAEAIVYLLQSGYSVGEFGVTVDPRHHGVSMYNAMSAVTYPLKVLFLIVVGALDARRQTVRRS